MADKELKNIFLSASIPVAERHPKYFETCDLTAIRDAVVALTSIVIKDYRLIWGGHPAITPIISRVLKTFGCNVSDHMWLYQSKWFDNEFPEENADIPMIILTAKKDDQYESLKEMRTQMIGENKYAAAFFIGGMEGVEEEYYLLKSIHPDCPIFPIASTGAAARIIFDKQDSHYDVELLGNLAYMSLFREIMKKI